MSMLSFHKIGFSLVALMLVFISSCKTVEKDCLSAGYENIRIEWGYLTKANQSEYYSLNSKSEIKQFVSDDLHQTVVDSFMINKNDMCHLINKTSALFLKVQTLNVPADSNNYITLYNNKTRVVLRALWNPVHDNLGNKEFKALYQELMTYILNQENRK